ncbi:hypothetical protein EVG20_g8465 [Dentipellis fragilis]|uniref:Uncharacterized protein n=1 Tax=Dentipellis fragilis TaxID=205917 RepID=A0A4Y9Y644_9AGAM|nr:hypothetical protein EVG20_g8465 [Dentipellis fragilis]
MLGPVQAVLPLESAIDLPSSHQDAHPPQSAISEEALSIVHFKIPRFRGSKITHFRTAGVRLPSNHIAYAVMRGPEVPSAYYPFDYVSGAIYQLLTQAIITSTTMAFPARNQSLSAVNSNWQTRLPWVWDVIYACILSVVLSCLQHVFSLAHPQQVRLPSNEEIDTLELQDALELMKHLEADSPHIVEGSTQKVDLYIAQGRLARRCFEVSEDSSHLGTAITFFSRALPFSCTREALVCHNLATTYLLRIDKGTMDEEEFDLGIALLRRSVALTPSNDPSRLPRLAILGASLSTRFKHSRDVEDLNDAITALPGLSASATSQPPAADAPEGEEPRLRPKWSLAARQGHAAMISGIRSLSATHDQLIIGWTGDIESPVSSSSGEKLTIPSNALSEEDKAALEHEIAHYEPDDDDSSLPSGIAERASAKSRTSYVPVWLEDGVAHGHYEGYCKNTLWPLFHYLLWQDVAPNSNSASFSADAHWPPYEAANAAFARRVAEIYQPGDLVWVHDYHLLLVPRMIRGLVGEGADADGQALPQAHPDGSAQVPGQGQGICIGLFVHTPWPSSEVFRCLPRRKEILDGMLGANLVCFQTYSYARHFVSSCVRVCGYEVAPTGKSGKGGDTGENMGIDVQGHVTADLLRPGIQPNLAALLKLYTGKKIIIGRDKLDVVKGVLQKLRAFAKLLRDYPEWRGKVVLIQVTSPALSDSPRLERQVSELVSNINGEFGGLDFVPVHHYHQTIKKDEFYALLSAADLGVITPLRDGMNTTSMEFVIAQDKTKHSPLVLSEFMGISSNMIEALQINPWNLGVWKSQDVAAAIDRGLRMSDEEKLTRHKALYQVATTHTSHTWAAMLVKMLLNAMDSQNMARQTPVLPLERMVERYAVAKKRLFLCDYDGTLAPIVKTPSMAVPSPETLEALETLSTNPRNLVYIISGRDGAFLEAHLGHLSHLGMSAEHGGFIREPGTRTWMNFTETLDMSWMDEVLEVFRYYTERTTGSHIEVKKSSITWHYRSSDPEWGQFQCRQCQDLLENNVAHKRPIEVLVGKKNLEVRPIAVNKGEIVKRILYEHPDAEFVFCAGDDKTDEDMFRSLCFQSTGADGTLSMDPPLSMTQLKDTPAPAPKTLALRADDIFTTAVGHATKRTLAKWHVTSPAEVIGGLLTLAGEERHERELELEHGEGEAKL